MLNNKILDYTIKLFRIQFAVLITFYLLRVFEFFYFNSNLLVPSDLILFELFGFVFDTLFWATYSLIIGILLLPFYNKIKIVKVTANIIAVLLILITIGLLMFFVERGAPLDKELVINSFSNNFTTVKSSDVLSFKLIIYTVLIIVTFVTINRFTNKINLHYKKVITVIAVWIVLFFINIFTLPSFLGYKYSTNKIDFLGKSIFNYIKKSENIKELTFDDFVLTSKMEYDIQLYQKMHAGSFVSTDYPLLRNSDSINSLGSYFNLLDKKPNIVILIVESLSSDFSGDNAELGNFITPFIDSLASQSLYWKNCLSSSAISFEVLPTIMGSLPYGQRGFSMLPEYPRHLSLTKILRANNYHTSFITGAPIYFDNQGAFMRNQGTDFLSYNFPEKYSKMNQDKGWNWGYPDDVIFKFGIENLDLINKSPYMDVYVTITTHPPYNFDEKDIYKKEFDKRLDKLDRSKKEKKNLVKIKDLLSAFIYTDDALKSFFEEYKKRDDYNNTIFIITGDHHGYFEPKNELGKFHVPLIVYSPLLNRAEKFKSVVTHHDIVPSLVNLLKAKYEIELPKYEHWIGKSLDTSLGFRIEQSLPLINWNKSIDYYLDGKYFLNKNRLFEIIDEDLNLNEVKDTMILNRVLKKMDVFKSVNLVCSYGNAIIPDSLLYNSNRYNKVILNETFADEIVTDKTYPASYRIYLEPQQTDIKIQIEFEIQLPKKPLDSLPKFIVKAKESGVNKKEFKDVKRLNYLNNDKVNTGKWVKMVLNDNLNLQDISTGNRIELKVYLHNPRHYKLKIRNYNLNILQ